MRNIIAWLKTKWYFKRVVLISLFFTIWLLFFDQNSFLVHQKLNREIHELRRDISFYSEEIHKDSILYSQLKDTAVFEKIAREQYYMKRPNEEVFLIKKAVE